jgi:hypothetical protein
MELLKQRNDWVLCTTDAVIRFTPEAVIVTNENGSVKLTAKPSNPANEPYMKVSEASGYFADGGGGWWSNIKDRRQSMFITYRSTREGLSVYEIDATVIDAEGNEVPAFHLRLAISGEGNVAGFYVSNVVVLDDFLRRLLYGLLMKHHKAGLDAQQGTEAVGAGGALQTP